MTTIHTIRLPLVNAFLVGGDGWIIVDAGAPGDHTAILRAAAAQGVLPSAIRLILLTHGHVDHFGGAQALRAATSAPVAVHRADAEFLRTGRNPELASTGMEGRIFRPFLPWVAPPLEPDLLFDDTLDLARYGVDGAILPTPGHSPGSISLRLGSDLIAGDLLRGGFMGGRLLGGRPNPPFYIDDPAAHAASLAQALALPVTTLYVGHGGPLSAEAARRRMAALVGDPAAQSYPV